MKITFEPREKIIIQGFLGMAIVGAQEAKNRKMRKYTERLKSKFEGTNDEINIKRDEALNINSILITVLDETNFDIGEGERPPISKEDYEVCKGLYDKLVKVC